MGSPARLVASLAAVAVTCPGASSLRAAPPTATLVRDIGQGVTPSVSDYFLAPMEGFVLFGGFAWFWADDGIHGRELWRTDGTAAGTSLFVDLCPGACGAVSLGSQVRLASALGRLYFGADDGVHGSELWSTDGTVPGTHLVRDITPGLRGSSPHAFTVTSTHIYFRTLEPDFSSRLWITDGTATGTRPFDSPQPWWYWGSRSVGPLAFFSYSGSLWRSDGTAAGSFELSSHASGTSTLSRDAPFQVLGERVIFPANPTGGPSQGELWASDGTPEGTTALAAGFEPRHALRRGSMLDVVAIDDLSQWFVTTTDGFSASTVPISLPPDHYLAAISGRWATLGNALYFSVYDAEHGNEPWKFENNVASRIIDLFPGPGSSMGFDEGDIWNGNEEFFVTLGQWVLFSADDGIHGRELWRTDGTAAGTTLVADLTPGPAGTSLDYFNAWIEFTALDGRLLFKTRSAPEGVRLWATDGTAAGTEMLAVIDGFRSAFEPPELSVPIYGSPPLWCATPAGRGLFFGAEDGTTGNEPWFTDATSGATEQVADLLAGRDWSYPRACSPIGGRVVWTAGAGESSPWGQGPFASSGAPGDLISLGSNEGDSQSMPRTYFGEELILAGEHLLATDGTLEGTRTLSANNGWGYFEEPLAFGGQLLMRAWGGEGEGPQLITVDGITGTVVPIEPEQLEASLAPERLTAVGDLVLFTSWQPAQGSELWRTDGTPEGTFLVRDILPGPGSAIPEEPYFIAEPPPVDRLVVLGDFAYFAADDGVRGAELWRSDGTFAGTQLVADLFPGPYPSLPRDLVRVGDVLFFTAESPQHGREIWRLDASGRSGPAVADLVPGAESSVPQELTAVGDFLYFSAWTPGSGREVWRQRGSSSAPFAPELWADLAPGPLSSSPLVFRAVGADVYTVANDGVHGFELWKLRDPDVLFADDFESSGLALWAAVEP